MLETIGGVIMILILLFIASLPFALIGWATITIACLFAGIPSDGFGYTGCVAVGIALVIVIHVIRGIFSNV